MRRVFFAVALGVGLAALAKPSAALAFGDENLVVNVPFAFNVEGVEMPAGRYAIEQADILDPQVVVIRSKETGKMKLFLTENGYPAHVVKSPRLVFDQYGDEEFLHAIWLPDASGAVFQASPAEIRAARAPSPTTPAATPATGRRS